MRWPVTIIVLLLVLAISLGLYRLESEVQRLERRLAVATAQLQDNRRDRRILAAEWSFLSQPSRLQALAQRHLALRSMVAAQIGVLAALPMKSQGPAGEASGNDGNDANDGTRGGQASEPPGKAPLPGWKPAKPRRGGQVVLASRGGGR